MPLRHNTTSRTLLPSGLLGRLALSGRRRSGAENVDAAFVPRLEDAPDIGSLRPKLEGSSILLAEDEAIVALDLEFALIDAGADVLGPAASLTQAMKLAQNATVIDGAILDIDLGEDSTFELAEYLVARDVPIVFHSGCKAIAEVGAKFPNAGILRKPVAVSDVLQNLASRMQ